MVAAVMASTLPPSFETVSGAEAFISRPTHVTYAARLTLLVVPLGDTRAEAWALGVLEDGEVYEAPLGIEAAITRMRPLKPFCV